MTSGRIPVVCMIAYTNYAFDARVRREAETLAAHGFRVLCLTTQIGAAPERFVLNGVEIRELAVPKYRGKSTAAYVASYLRFLVHASARCLRLLREDTLDVVHAHNLPDFLVLAGVVPRVCGRKVVLDVHDSVPETFATKFSGSSLLQWVLRLEERVSARVAHRVICVNHPQRDMLVARGIPEAKTFISMNVPDPRIFGSQTTETTDAARDGDFNLVYHGTMAERLGVDLLIRAVGVLRDRIPRLRLHLWGGGDDLPSFQRLAHEIGLDGRVLFEPRGYPLEELPHRLGSMDAGVVGNRRSAAGELMLPVKLLEYVSLNIPAIVPRLRAIRHYFDEDMVGYYEPGDVESLAGRIQAVHDMPERRRCQAVRARQFLARYGSDRQDVELVALYRELLAN